MSPERRTAAPSQPSIGPISGRGAGDAHLPRLAVMFSPLVLVLQLCEVAAGNRQLLWIVDTAVDGVAEHVRLLRRLGPVIDITGLDITATVEVVRAHEPNGIIAFGESEMLKAAFLAQALGLPSNDPAVVQRLVNKAAQREALGAAGLGVPQYWTSRRGVTPDGARALARRVRYPAIVKPQEGAGSRDVRRVTDPDALVQLFREFSLNASPRGDSREIETLNNVAAATDDLIIEELLPDAWPRDSRPYADFVSVESVVSQGKISHLAVTGRAALAEPFRETGNFIPSNLPAQSIEVLVGTATRAIAAIGATTGCLHTEVKLTPDGPRIIELNGRIGGSIPELMRIATGTSILDVASRVALGEAVHFDSLLPCAEVGYSLVAPPPVGATRLLALDNIEALRNISGIDALTVNRQAGDPVDWREGYASRIYSVYGAAADHDRMWQIRAAIQESIKMTFAWD